MSAVIENSSISSEIVVLEGPVTKFTSLFIKNILYIVNFVVLNKLIYSDIDIKIN